MIAKPFDAMTLAATVRRYSQDARLAPLRTSFVRRAHKDAEALATCRLLLASAERSSAALAVIRTIAHGLAGAAGIYGFAEISDAAGALENDAIAELAGGSPGQAGQALDTLLALLASLADASSESTQSRFNKRA